MSRHKAAPVEFSLPWYAVLGLFAFMLFICIMDDGRGWEAVAVLGGAGILIRLLIAANIIPPFRR